MRTSEKNTKQAQFLAAFAICPSIRNACEVSGVPRSTVYQWEKTDSDFAKRFAEANEDANDRIDEEIHRRAVTGWEEPLVSAGKLVCNVRKYSDAMMTMLAKSRMSKFREKQQVEMSGPDGGPIQQEVIQVYIPDNGRDEVKGGDA